MDLRWNIRYNFFSKYNIQEYFALRKQINKIIANNFQKLYFSNWSDWSSWSEWSDWSDWSGWFGWFD